ncbi:MAG: helix-turn-helix domain-containing protein [Vicinamibacterales bacterium]
MAIRDAYRVVDMATNSMPRLQFDGRKLYEDAVAKGVDIAQLVDRSGKSQRTVYRFITGELQTAETAQALSRALGYSVSRYLIRSEVA